MGLWAKDREGMVGGNASSPVQHLLRNSSCVSITGFSILGMLIGLQYLEVEALSQNKKKN